MELLQYLCSHFEKNYKVCVANNGIEGLKKVSEKEPDIIITDIIMPELNGYQFCKQVKNNFNSSHIPVIMLTANHSTDQIIEGLSCGADSYIAKPFDIQHLDATAKALLKNRKKVREKYLGVEKIDLQSERQSSEDIRFVNELKEFILNNITREDLNVEMLSGHFSVSRSQLNRKIKALTNLTPNNYIKMLRLKKAYELIKTKGYRVAEAAYMTGFSDPNYFTLCFTREFGENPSKIVSG